MIQAEKISFSYSHKKILDELSFSATTGSFTCIIGENGCGKSTLLSILTGCLKPDSGSVIYGDHNLTLHPADFGKYIGYVPQDNALIPELTVLDNLLFWYSGSKSRLLEELSQSEYSTLNDQEILHQKINTLSGGQKKRVSILSALLSHPRVLVLDEPCSALDLIGKQRIHDFLSEYVKNNGIVIMTTHDEADISLCTKLYLLQNKALYETNKQVIH